MRESFRLYLKFLNIALRSRMQYRSDFIIGIVGVILSNAVMLALIWFLFQQFQSFQGWTFWEVVMLYSMFLCSHTIFAIFFWQIYALEDTILEGGFDQFLLRPTSPFLQFIGRELNYPGFGDLILAITIFVIAYRNLALHWSPIQFLLFILFVLAGAAIETSIFIMFATVSFWAGRSRSLFTIGFQFNNITRQYPLDLFGKNYQLFVTIVFPIAFMNYYPLTGLLGKSNGLNIPILGYLSPIVAIIAMSLAAVGWHFGVQNYSSSGS